jgi:hypothetical protein
VILREEHVDMVNLLANWSERTSGLRPSLGYEETCARVLLTQNGQTVRAMLATFCRQALPHLRLVIANANDFGRSAQRVARRFVPL